MEGEGLRQGAQGKLRRGPNLNDLTKAARNKIPVT